MVGDHRCSRWDAEGLGFASRDNGHRFSLSALSSRHVLRLLAVGADVEHMSDVLVGSRTCNLLGALQIPFLRASRTPRAGGLQRKASVVGRPSTRGMLVFIKSSFKRVRFWVIPRPVDQMVPSSATVCIFSCILNFCNLFRKQAPIF